MDRTTVFTKTAKGLMEATGKTSVLSRDLRTLLKEIDGKATVGEVQTKFGKVPEAKLQEALKALAKEDFIREFTQAALRSAPQTAAPPPKGPAADDDMDLDFTVAIPTLATLARQAEEAARQKALAAAAVEAAARAKAEAEARARAAAAEAAARAKAGAEARARAEAEARAKRDAEEQARREAEERARTEAEARAKADEQARIEAEARARKEAEERARVEAELKARLEDERKALEEAERLAKEQAERERKEAEEKARREADELRAKREEERRAGEEAERKAKEQAERERNEAEERARVEAELKAKLEEERRAREQTERKAKEEAERERKQAEEKARREADELRAKLEEERRAREDAERKAKEQTERKAKEDAERKAKEHAERKTKEDAERKAKEQTERKTKEDAERKAKEHAERVAREAGERARQEAEHQARREAEARAHEEAEERSRREAEDQAKREAETTTRREAEETTRKDAEEKARREAAEQARPQAPVESGPSLDDLVKIETDFDAVLGAGGGTKQEAANVLAGADDKMQQEAEEKVRRETEEQARNEAEEKAHREAEAEAEREEEERRRKDKEEQERTHVEDRAQEEPAAREREHAEAQARLEAQNEETELHFAEMEKELEAEQAAAKDEKKPPESPQDARKRDKEEARERVHAEAAGHTNEAEAAFEEAPVVYRTPINWGKPVAVGLFLILILGLVLVHLVSFDGYIPQFEKLAGAHLQQPVKIEALHLSLVPLPHWRLDGVAVGNEGQLAVAQINAVAELGSMFSDQKVFKSIELESPVLSEEGLRALLFGKPQGQDFKVASVIVRNGKLNSKTFILPALDAKIAVGENGAWQKIALETPDHKTSLLLEPKGEALQLEVETNAFSMPFGPAFILENFIAKGVVGRDELRLSEFKGGIYGGYLSGNVSLKWGADWSLGGEISVRAMDPGSIVPTLIEDGKLEGKAVYAMRAKSYDELFAAPRLEGAFAVQKGSLLGVDLARLLQGSGVGGKTAFTELTGSFVREGGRTQLRQVHLGAGPVSANGSADADASKNISGRFTVELKSPVAQARANLAVSGTLREPRFSR